MRRPFIYPISGLALVIRSRKGYGTGAAMLSYIRNARHNTAPLTSRPWSRLCTILKTRLDDLIEPTSWSTIRLCGGRKSVWHKKPATVIDYEMLRYCARSDIMSEKNVYREITPD